MADLTGLRVLVVEDEGAVALLIESMLEELGCHVTASVATLAKAQSAARSDAFDFALLDINLNGELVFPVAEILKGRQLPFIFSTGYGRVGVPESFKECEVLNKPYTIEELSTKLQSMFSKSDGAAFD
ncbi:response regulator [Mesorhizobium sp. B2-4-9]|uniref:response regulator n=1 Tax=Mesorhizobium sp. B2-4-9 TaxID=2589940 RepID=UPI0011279CBC|nr:response regulator [Mesorhizobium sp. B2-4-9]TPL21093.1 response regulator [Mesorhizobium sp. B2-4-9]